MKPKTIAERLDASEPDEKLQSLVQYLKKKLKDSRSRMSKDYPKWDRNVAVYRGEIVTDAADLRARQRREPEKSIIPLSFAQVQTFVSFGFLLLTQNPRFFEMTSTGVEDEEFRDLIERGLQRDLTQNQWSVKLYQWLLDLARTSIAPLKFWWTVDTQSVRLEVPEALDSNGTPTYERFDAVSFEGNRIQNVKPKAFLPDVSKSLTEWESGQFVADEDIWHITNVKSLQKRGLAHGVQHVKRQTKTTWADRNGCGLAEYEDGFSKSGDETDFMVVLTEGNVWLNPLKYALGPEDYPILFTFRMANDRLISLEEQGALHGKFNYVLAQFSPDNEAKLNEGLSDVIDALQETISWLMNSRIASVRNTMDRHLVVNSQFIDTAALEARSPIIYTRKNAPVVDVRQLVSQLDMRDTTTTHFSDADTLLKTMQFVTGVNENAMGQYAPGRRSATENRAANNGAASRMKVTLSCAWDSCLGPLGRRLSSNQRQSMGFDTFRKIFGEDEKTAMLFEKFAPQDPFALIGNEDYFSLDGTLQSEKGFLAQSLQELMSVVLSNPEFAMRSGFDMEKVVTEIQKLRGVTHVAKFFQTPSGIGGLGLSGTPQAPIAAPGI